MRGDYTIADMGPVRAINALDDIFSSNDVDYFITGGFNVQALIAAQMISRLEEAGKTDVCLSDLPKMGKLYRPTGDVDAVADFDTVAELAEFLNKNRFGRSDRISYVGQGKETTYVAPCVKYELGDRLKQPLKINIYAKRDPFMIASRPVKVPIKKNVDLNARILLSEALVAQKLASTREKDIGDVERLILIFGEDLDVPLIDEYAYIKGFDRDRILTTFYDIYKKYIENK